MRRPSFFALENQKGNIPVPNRQGIELPSLTVYLSYNKVDKGVKLE